MLAQNTERARGQVDAAVQGMVQEEEPAASQQRFAAVDLR